MPPTRQGTRSTFNSRVTLYEPPTDVKPPTSEKRTRSTRGSSPAAVTEDVKPSFRAKKPPTPRKPKAFQTALDVPAKAPKRWEEAYDVIRRQRETIVAPVDTMGCEQGGRERTDVPPSDKDNRLSILVSLMLSSQTKDPVTHQAVKNLRDNLQGGLCLQGLLDATPEEINSCICKVGFHNIKTANLAKLAVRLRDLHDGDVPSELPALLAINGVGPKMGILYLQAIGINAGIGVDVHVHRITNRLGWHKPTTTTPEQTRLNLESWLPKHLHPKINLMLVGFGQEICKPVGPRCDLCDVAAVSPSLCPSARRGIVKKEASSPVKRETGSSPSNKRRKVEDVDMSLVEVPRSPPKVVIELEETRVKLEAGEKIEGQVSEATDAGEKSLQESVTIKAEQSSPHKLAW